MSPNLRVPLTCCFLVASAWAQAPLKIPAHGAELQRTPSGLQFSVLSSGRTEQKARPGDQVRFHYSGWFADGTLFETSRRNPQPRTMILGVGMLPAWSEVMNGMAVGSRLRVDAPAELCFGKWGTKGNPPSEPPVPPNTDLVFEIELLERKPSIELPRYRLPDPSKQRTTESGLRYELLRDGQGPVAELGSWFELEFSVFNDRGLLVATSRVPGQTPISGRVGAPIDGPPFLREAVALMRTGDRMRCDVPATLGYGDVDRGYLLPKGQPTVWVLELAAIYRPRTVPEFARLDPRAQVCCKSGLRYQVLEPGGGKPPTPDATVTVHYAGWLADGTRFDESLTKGRPLTLRLERAIPGWVEALQAVGPGAKLRILVPPALAYGLHGRPELKIGPNRILYYYVELLKVSSQ
ncbi:MAG: FKBP-type peptidyl-prolyl cis-trans isomerase [Planctomycetes bacterium]|nr:FKBP-type peptidyl-prolyl cis-trans isomerase [Planctomycetota bacterium]